MRRSTACTAGRARDSRSRPASVTNSRSIRLAMIIPYYPETNPGFVALAKRAVDEVLADLGA